MLTLRELVKLYKGLRKKTNEWNEREKRSKVLDGNISSGCIYTGEHPC